MAVTISQAPTSASQSPCWAGGRSGQQGYGALCWWHFLSSDPQASRPLQPAGVAMVTGKAPGTEFLLSFSRLRSGFLRGGDPALPLRVRATNMTTNSKGPGLWFSGDFQKSHESFSLREKARKRGRKLEIRP